MARILIVDDEADVLFLLEANMEVMDHECVATGDLAEATKRLRNESFDVLILDVTMPDKDGPTFLGELREAGLAPQHVFLLSAIPPQRLEAVASEVGARAISKPFTSSTLSEALREALQS